MSTCDLNFSPSHNLTEPLSEKLILELARSLHGSGSPAYELESQMEHVATALGRQATFFSTPTALFVTFDDERYGTRLLRVYPGKTNLGRYAELYSLQQSIQEESITAEEALDQLRVILSMPDGYPNWGHFASYGVVGLCVAVLVGGNDTVVITAGVVGLIVGGLEIGLARLQFPPHLTNVIAGLPLDRRESPGR